MEQRPVQQHLDSLLSFNLVHTVVILIFSRRTLKAELVTGFSSRLSNYKVFYDYWKEPESLSGGSKHGPRVKRDIESPKT
jgi:hypothetical protein